MIFSENRFPLFRIMLRCNKSSGGKNDRFRHQHNDFIAGRKPPERLRWRRYSALARTLGRRRIYSEALVKAVMAFASPYPPGRQHRAARGLRAFPGAGEPRPSVDSSTIAPHPQWCAPRHDFRRIFRERAYRRFAGLRETAAARGLASTGELD